jgi:hypothetical protein
MKKYVTRIPFVCALAFGVGFSPAFAAAFSRGMDVGATLFAMRSMIGSLGAIRERLPPFGSARGSMGQIISLL